MLRGVKTLRKQSLQRPKSSPDGGLVPDEAAIPGPSIKSRPSVTIAQPSPLLRNATRTHTHNEKLQSKVKSDCDSLTATAANPQQTHPIRTSEGRTNNSNHTLQQRSPSAEGANAVTSSSPGRATRRQKHDSGNSMASIGDLVTSGTVESYVQIGALTRAEAESDREMIDLERANGSSPNAHSKSGNHSALRSEVLNQGQNQKHTSTAEAAELNGNQHNIRFLSAEEQVKVCVRDRIGSTCSMLSVRSNKSVSVSICSTGSQGLNPVDFRKQGTNLFSLLSTDPTRSHRSVNMA